MIKNVMGKRGRGTRDPIWTYDPLRHKCDVDNCNNTAQYKHTYYVCVSCYITGYRGDPKDRMERL